MNRAALLATFFQIPLMIFFGSIKRLGSFHLSHDREAKLARRRKRCDLGFHCRLLLLVVIEDYRSVLVADIRPLAIQRRRVVKLEKDVQ